MARVGGCLFVSGASGSNFEHYEPSIKFLYLAYVIFMAVIVCTFESCMIARRVSLLEPGKDNFFEKLFISLHLIDAVKVLTNFFCLSAGTSELVNVLRALKKLEFSIGFQSQDNIRSRAYRYGRIVGFGVPMTMCGLCRVFVMAKLTADLPAVMAWTLRTLSGIFIMYYLVIGSMVLFLERYLCVVLSNYLSYQVGAAKEIVRRAVRDGEAQRLAFDVDRIRLSYVATAKIVSQVDSWLRYALVVVFMCSTFVVCMIVYAIFAGDPPSSMVLGTAFYAMFTYLAIVDVALSASDIKTQGRKLKSVLQSASTTEVPARIARQVRRLF
ncbi:hypothetical protein HPB48_006066 [Haemaphysalis longicornis]|uniref:Gustatory receptor n=1 Tax=Haemaphysalis longicornis TaxID=44386 RepID=A0A9J6FVT5_HAELO|nr:hypothetical protein HPB48_006066 [Haemaphysalis longicornis]